MENFAKNKITWLYKGSYKLGFLGDKEERL